MYKEIRKIVNSYAVAGILCLATAFTSCKKDESKEPTPNFFTEFCDAYANSQAVVSTLTLDDGRKLDVLSQGIKFSSGKGNRSIRAVARFAEVDGQIKVYDLDQAFCSPAIPVDSFKVKPRHPLQLLSMWRAGKYVNLIFARKTTDADNHAYDFCIDSVVNRKLFVSFLHYQPEDDPMSYSERTYASMPVTTKYVDASTYDSISISVNTFDGLKTLSFKK